LQKRADAPTFDELYQAYAERVLNLAYRLTANEEQARDLTQEVFIKVYENLGTFKHEAHVYTWIYRIAVNHIYNHLKKEGRYRWLNLMDRSVSDILRDEKMDSVYHERTARPSVDRQLEKAERAQIVWATIQELSPKYRVPLVMHHYEGMSYKDIAEAMQISMSAVESRIHRARRQLIEKLKPWIEDI
jgi:RNA polymerase sigma-70 factor (ECF subfamily)